MPDIADSDFRGVVALLMLMENPEEMKKKVEELQELTKTAQDAHDEIRRGREEAQKLHTEATTRFMEGQKAFAAVTAKEEALNKKTVDLEKERVEFDAMVKEGTAILNQKKDLAEAKDRELLKREQGIASRETRLAELERDNEALKAELLRKMTAMRNTLQAMG